MGSSTCRCLRAWVASSATRCSSTIAAWRKWKVAVHLHGSELDRLHVEQARPVRWCLRDGTPPDRSIAVLGKFASSSGSRPSSRRPDRCDSERHTGRPIMAAESAHDRQFGVFLGNFLRRKGVIEAVRAAALVVAREPGARFCSWATGRRSASNGRHVRWRAWLDRRSGSGSYGRASEGALLARAGFLLFPPVQPGGAPEGDTRGARRRPARNHDRPRGDRGDGGDGECGFVLADASPELLAEAMLMLIRDAGLWTRMSAAARRRYHAYIQTGDR